MDYEKLTVEENFVYTSKKTTEVTVIDRMMRWVKKDNILVVVTSKESEIKYFYLQYQLIKSNERAEILV
jgi:hypothetical protein